MVAAKAGDFERADAFELYKSTARDLLPSNGRHKLKEDIHCTLGIGALTCFDCSHCNPNIRGLKHD